MVEIGKHLVEIVRTPKEHIEEMTAAKIRIFLAVGVSGAFCGSGIGGAAGLGF